MDVILYTFDFVAGFSFSIDVQFMSPYDRQFMNTMTYPSDDFLYDTSGE